MSNPTLRELKTQVKELQAKIERFEEPLDYRNELEAMNNRGWKTLKAECGGPVKLQGDASRVIITIKQGSVGFNSEYIIDYVTMKYLARLSKAVHNSHGC